MSQQKALVIDDSRAVRMILARTLIRLGFEVLQTADGCEALEVLDGHRDEIRLALVDWNMPRMNGLDFVKAVRSDTRNANIALIMVTTETQVEQMVAALEAGANEYVMKPFTDDIIAGKLRLAGIPCQVPDPTTA